MPITVPADWVSYTHFSEAFRLWHPPLWRLLEEGPLTAKWQDKETSNIFIAGLQATACDTLESQRQETLDCLVVETARAAAELERGSFEFARKRLWDDGVHSGYAVEFLTRGTLDTDPALRLPAGLLLLRPPSFHLWVYIPVESGRVLRLAFEGLSTIDFVESERQLFTALLRSVRVDSGPVPRVVATAMPMPMLTPDYAVGDTLEARDCTAKVTDASQRDRSGKKEIVVMLDVTCQEGKRSLFPLYSSVRLYDQHGRFRGWSGGRLPPAGTSLWELAFEIPDDWEGPLYLLFLGGWAEGLDGIGGKTVDLGLVVE